MNILITGATGLVGSAIVNHCLTKKYTVHFLTTSRNKIVNQPNYKGFYWNPDTNEIDVKCLEGVKTIINLAGASISKKWTASYKQKMLDSRVKSVALLYQLLSENKHEVVHIIAASALGIYPSSLHKKYQEDSKEVSSSFLGDLVYKWEKEVDSLRVLDLKISKVRIGIVLSKNGGALTAMLKPIKLGVGAPLGTGKQFQSWIHIEDLAALFVFIAENSLTGVFNAVASNPVTNSEMTKIAANQLKKPLWLPKVPKFVLQLILGEMAALILESQYLKNDKIKKEGFIFNYESIEEALAQCLI